MGRILAFVFFGAIFCLVASFIPHPALATVPHNAGAPYYLAFGDSFTSGEGELSDSFYINSTNSPHNHCHVSSRSYPYLLEAAWGIVTLNLACSGSRISNVQEASRNFITGDTSVWWPSVVSLGVGGNDVDLMGKLKTCINIGTCEWAKGGIRRSAGYEIKALYPKIHALITELKTSFSSASFFVVGYPSVINDTADAPCSMVIGAMLNAEERRYMSESIRYLNQVLRVAAFYAGTPFIDIETAYGGERLCDEKTSAMNGVRYGDDMAPIPMLSDVKLIGAESFHPTPRGHQLAASSINYKLGSVQTSPGCSHCPFNESQLDMPPYWSEEAKPEEPVLQMLAKKFLNIETFTKVTDVAFSFLPQIFAPQTWVKFELHSDPHQLGIFKTSSDGSLQGTLTLPDDVTGYHTIHAYGEGISGENLDVYQTVYIDTIKTNGIAELSDGGGQSSGGDSEASLAIQTTSNGAEILGNTSSRIYTKANNRVQPKSSHGESIIWWFIASLIGTGLLLIGVASIIARRKNKSLLVHSDR